ncbi:hypothetical protein ACIQMJ_08980 [Actinosynnema sp. NPDC091369]
MGRAGPRRWRTSPRPDPGSRAGSGPGPAVGTRGGRGFATRKEIGAAVDALADPGTRAAGRRLLDHADERGAQLKGGNGAYPSSGVYYPFGGNRRSLASLYLSAERPELTVDLRSIWDQDQALASDVLTKLRGHPGVNALLPADDDLVRKYPSFDLATLGAAPGALDALLDALDLVVRPTAPLTGGYADEQSS